LKLLLDEQISGKVAVPLQGKGHDVLAVTDEPALRGLSDPELFELAQEQERVVVTFNVADFVAIVREFAQEGRTHWGLILVNQGRLPSSDFGRLAVALDAFLAEPPRGESFVSWLQPPA
jgi:predicted nuclease of predicted toxin-antitoxin system